MDRTHATAAVLTHPATFAGRSAELEAEAEQLLELARDLGVRVTELMREMDDATTGQGLSIDALTTWHERSGVLRLLGAIGRVQRVLGDVTGSC